MAAGGASSDDGVAAAANVGDVPVGRNKGAKAMDEGNDNSGGKGAEDLGLVYLVEAAATTVAVVARRLAASRWLPRLRKAEQGRGFSWAQVRGKTQREIKEGLEKIERLSII